jgi:hypothetical protein
VTTSRVPLADAARGTHNTAAEIRRPEARLILVLAGLDYLLHKGILLWRQADISGGHWLRTSLCFSVQLIN